MGKIIDGHLVNFEDVQEMIDDEDYINFGGAMTDTVDSDVYDFDLATEVWCY